MTILLTFVGVVVFFISLVTAGFKKAFWRLVGFVIVGFVIDVMLATLVAAAYYLNR